MRGDLVCAGLVGDRQMIEPVAGAVQLRLRGKHHDRDSHRDMRKHPDRHGVGEHDQPIAPPGHAEHQVDVVALMSGRDEDRIAAAPGGALHPADDLVIPVGRVATVDVFVPDEIGEAQSEHAGPAGSEVSFAAPLGTYPSSATAASTRSLVGGSTRPLPASTLDTVAVDTLARSATSYTVGVTRIRLILRRL